MLEVLDNGTVIVMCVFAIASDADGCYVVMSDLYSSYSVEMAIDKYSVEQTTATAIVTVGRESNFTVAVYDIVDGAVSDVAAIVGNSMAYFISPPVLSTSMDIFIGTCIPGTDYM